MSSESRIRGVLRKNHLRLEKTGFSVRPACWLSIAEALPLIIGLMSSPQVDPVGTWRS